jgi:UDP-galactopyranose mutase
MGPVFNYHISWDNHSANGILFAEETRLLKMAKKISDTVIIGGGLAGLSAAYYGRFPLYEALDRPGGTADSIHKDGFTFDIGIHVLHSRELWFYDLIKNLGVELITHKRRAWIYSYRRYSSYPLQVNTSHLTLRNRIRCVAGFLTRRKNSNPKNYEEWMIKNFGKGFAKTFLITYAEKFWHVPPGEMTYEWTGARIPQPSLIEVIKGAFRNQESTLGPNAEFHYPKEYQTGFASIAKALASQIETIYYSMKATSIDPYKKTISFNNAETEVVYDRLITTMALPELIKLLPSVPADIQNAVSKLRCNSIAIVNVGVDRPKVSDKHWIHFPEKDISFFRLSFPSNFCDGLNPVGTSSIQTEVSYDKNNPPERNNLIRQVHDDLIKVGILKPEDHISFKDVVYKKYGYVVYDKARKESVNKIHEFLNNLSIYPCGRYGDWEYLWSDQAIFSGNSIKAILKHFFDMIVIS